VDDLYLALSLADAADALTVADVQARLQASASSTI
jgi:hypothetical protein